MAVKVVVYWDKGSFRMSADGVLFEIDEVSLQKGTPSRNEEKASFKFEANGPAAWAFISVTPA